MRFSDLKPGMFVQVRAGDCGYVWRGGVLLQSIWDNIPADDYQDGLKNVVSSQFDIIKVWKSNGNYEEIWRAVDWNKIPIDTKIFVKIGNIKEWLPRHFAGVTENGKIKFWAEGGTSFTKEVFAALPEDNVKLARKDD